MKINRMISKSFPSYSSDDGVYMGVNTPKRITFHNTAGGTSAKSFAQSEQTSNGWSAGIPNYYVDKDEVWQVLEDNTVSWANGTYQANDGAITIEIVDGYKDLNDFKQAEKLAIELGKYLADKYKIKVTDSNFRLHREYVATACPKRSADLHGGTTKTRKFFMDGVNGSPVVHPDKPVGEKPENKTKGDYMNGKVYTTVAGAKLTSNNLLGIVNGKRTATFNVKKGETYLAFGLNNNNYLLMSDTPVKDDKKNVTTYSVVELKKSDFDNLTFSHNQEIGK